MSRTNHFYYSYIGSKRSEIKEFESYLPMTSTNIFVEPFAGSAAVAFHLWQNNPNRQIVIGDRDPFLIELWDRVIDPLRLDETIEECQTFMDSITDKESYDSIVRRKTWISDFVANSYHSFRRGVYPANKPKINYRQLFAKPYTSFLRSPSVELYRGEFMDLCDRYKNDPSAFIFLDPPYVNDDNSYYSRDASTFDLETLYLYIQDLFKHPCKCMMIVSDRLLMRLLFKDYIKGSYAKRYSLSKKTTRHLIITNYTLP